MPSIKKKSKNKTKKRGGAASNDIIHSMPIIDLYTSIHNYLAFQRVMQQGPASKIDNNIRQRLTSIFSLDERNENSRLYLFLFRCMTIDNNIFTKQPMTEFKERMVQILQDKMKTNIKTLIDNSIHVNLKVSDIEPIFQELIDDKYIDELQEVMNIFTLEYFKEEADEVETPIIDRTTYKSIMNVIKVIVIGYVNKDRFDLYSYELLRVIPDDIAQVANPSHIQNVMENFMTNVVHAINIQLNQPENLVTRAVLNPFVFLRDIGSFLLNHINEASKSIQTQITKNSKTNIILAHIQKFFLKVHTIEPISESGEPRIFEDSELENVIDKIILLSNSKDSTYGIHGTSLHNILENLKNMIVMFQDRKLMETISTRRTMILNHYGRRSVSIDQSELRKRLNGPFLGRSASEPGLFKSFKYTKRKLPGKNKNKNKYKYLKLKKKRIKPFSNRISNRISNVSKSNSRRATSSSHSIHTSPITADMNYDNRTGSKTNYYSNSNSD